MEFFYHITFDVKYKLQFLQAEEVGWSLVAILNWVQLWRRNGRELLLNNASGAIHGRRCSCNNNTGVGSNVGI
jgi:hypothetical protein